MKPRSLNPPRVTFSGLGFLALIATAVLQLTGCSKTPVGPPATANPIIPPTTIVIDSAAFTSHFVSLSPDSTIYTFTLGLPVVDSLHAGDVMVSSHGFGVLRKVASVSHYGGETVVTTTSATLTDAITQCQIVASNQPMTPSRASLSKGVIPLGGVRMVAENKIQIFNLQIKNADSEVVATLNGAITLDPKLNFELTIDNAQITHFLASVDLNETANLSGQATLFDVNLSSEKEIYSEVMDPIIVFAAAVPIVITPVLEVNIGADGEVSASVSTSATYNQTYTAGISWDNGAWSPVATQTQTFGYQPPQFSSEADFKAYATPEFSMLLYGVVGPFVNATLYGHFNAQLGRIPLALFEVGLNVEGGLAAGVLSDALHPLTIPNIIDFHDTLWKSDTGMISPQVFPITETVLAVDSENATGINIMQGNSYSWSSTGEWSPQPISWEYCGGNGEGFNDPGGEVVPNTPGMALIGKIGASGQWFWMGASGTFQAMRSGTLYLAANDIVGDFGDNVGSLSVTVNKQ